MKNLGHSVFQFTEEVVSKKERVRGERKRQWVWGWKDESTGKYKEEGKENR